MDHYKEYYALSESISMLNGKVSVFIRTNKEFRRELDSYMGGIRMPGSKDEVNRALSIVQKPDYESKKSEYDAELKKLKLDPKQQKIVDACRAKNQAEAELQTQMEKEGFSPTVIKSTTDYINRGGSSAKAVDDWARDSNRRLSTILAEWTTQEELGTRQSNPELEARGRQADKIGMLLSDYEGANRVYRYAHKEYGKTLHYPSSHDTLKAALKIAAQDKPDTENAIKRMNLDEKQQEVVYAAMKSSSAARILSAAMAERGFSEEDRNNTILDVHQTGRGQRLHDWLAGEREAVEQETREFRAKLAEKSDEKNAEAAPAKVSGKVAQSARKAVEKIAVDDNNIIVVKGNSALSKIVKDSRLKGAWGKAEEALGGEADKLTVTLVLSTAVAEANGINRPDHIQPGWKINVAKTVEKIDEVVSKMKQHATMTDEQTPGKITGAEYRDPEHGLKGKTTKDILGVGKE